MAKSSRETFYDSPEVDFKFLILPHELNRLQKYYGDDVEPSYQHSSSRFLFTQQDIRICKRNS